MLVVDATFDTRTRICDQLRETGASVRGCDPLENVVTSVFGEVRPHWVVIDPGPLESGYRVVAALRRRDPQCRLIVLGAYVATEFRQRALESGADHFLDKASEFDKAISLIAEAVGDR